jgi:Fe-S-cluster containining protein
MKQVALWARIAEEVEVSIQSRPGHCCSQNLINVCAYDVWLIATGLSLSPTSFLAFAQMEADSPHHFRLDGSDQAYCLALNMREQSDGSRRCIFLMELPNGQTRYGIYGLRPIACRAYPLALTEDGVAVKPWAMCRERYPSLSGSDVAIWQAEMERHDMEFSVYALAVETWNRKVMEQADTRELDFRPFLDFLMGVYGRLEPARRAVPEESWPAIWSRWRGFTVEGLNPLLLPVDASVRYESWTGWLQSIREAVGESVQASASRAVDPGMLPEEISV